LKGIMTPQSSENKLDFVPVAAEQQLMPAPEVRSLGAAMALPPLNAGSMAVGLTGRAALSLRQGYDPVDASPTGRVLDGGADVGITLRAGANTLLSLTAARLTYRAGLDNPLVGSSSSPAVVGEANAPGLKVTAAKLFNDGDCVASVSFDLSQRKPEFTFGWGGAAFAERGSLVLHADPLLRTYKMAAAASFPGVLGLRTHVACARQDPSQRAE
jgi:hypothetical protein